jgi:predicted nucleic-acid-binding Zn-ribbon protein
MSIGRRAREYERTCDDCGYVWHVPKEVARPHLRASNTQGVGKYSGQAEDGLLYAFDELEGVNDANAALSERAAASRRCPKCESDHYTERAIRS